MPVASKMSVWKSQSVPKWELVRGQEFVYDMDYSGSGLFTRADGSGLQFRVQGQFVLTVLNPEEGGYRVWLKLQDLNLTELDALPAEFKTNLQQGWQRGVLAKLANRGFQLDLLAGPLGSGSDQAFWRRFLERIKVEVPLDLPNPYWQQQDLPSGAAVSTHYKVMAWQSRQLKSQEDIILRKSFRGSLSLGRFVNGHADVTLGPNFSGLKSLAYQDQENQNNQEHSWNIESKLSLRLFRLVQLNSQQILALESQLSQASWAQKSLNQELQFQKVALGQSNFQEIWALLQSSTGESETQANYLKLKAWISLHPAQLPLLNAQLQSLEDSDALLNLSIRALAAAGHHPAQQALLQILEERRESIPVARKLIMTIGFLADPSSEAQKALEVLSLTGGDSSLRRGSRLALGVMGQHLKQSPGLEAQQRGQRILAEAQKDLLKAKNPADKAMALAVIGNSGPKNFQDLEPWLRDSDASIRAQAFFALRFADDIETPQFFAASFLIEKDLEVRRQILLALSIRNIDLNWFQALEVLAANSSSADDQIAIARSLMRSYRLQQKESLVVFNLLQTHAVSGQVEQILTNYMAAAQGQTHLL